jgi:hypothetical protein
MKNVLDVSAMAQLEAIQSAITNHDADSVTINSYDCTCDAACRDL